MVEEIPAAVMAAVMAAAAIKFGRWTAFWWKRPAKPSGKSAA